MRLFVERSERILPFPRYSCLSSSFTVHFLDLVCTNSLPSSPENHWQKPANRLIYQRKQDNNEWRMNSVCFREFIMLWSDGFWKRRKTGKSRWSRKMVFLVNSFWAYFSLKVRYFYCQNKKNFVLVSIAIVFWTSFSQTMLVFIKKMSD